MRDFDIASYLAGDQTPEEREEAARVLAADPELRREVDELAAIGGHLSELPAGAWRPPEPVAAERRPRVRRWVAAGGAAVAVAAVVVAVVLGAGDSEPAGPPARPLAALDQGTGGGSVRLVAGPQGRRLDMRVEGLTRSPRGTFYEVWLMGPGTKIVSLGTFTVGPGGRAAMRVPVPVDPARYRYIDVSREADDDNPAHSGDSVLRAPAS